MSTDATKANLNLAMRIGRFAIVGTMCYFVQLMLAHAIDFAVPLYCAEAIAFLLSAQLNFTLSQIFTWGDRQHAERLMKRWVKFNANALVSVAIVNATIFWLLVQAGVWIWAAMLLANLVSTVWTFSMNHFVVFKAEQLPPIVPGEGRHANIAH
jgi:putative flippase GtrA